MEMEDELYNEKSIILEKKEMRIYHNDQIDLLIVSIFLEKEKEMRIYNTTEKSIFYFIFLSFFSIIKIDQK